MTPRRSWTLASIAFACTAVLVAAAHGMDFFVATDGDDLNDGTMDFPFASFDHAINQTEPGDTIYVRGGTYNLTERVRIKVDESGEEGNRINLWAWPGETPILDFSGMDEALNGQSSGRGIQFDREASWWHVKGLTIQNARDNGLYSGGNYNIIQQVVSRMNGDSGIQLHDTASHNLILNCDSYENYDPYTTTSDDPPIPIPGENADGFAVKDDEIGPGNIFYGNRAWGNSDDGWDTFDATGSGVFIRNCWSFDNGFNTWLVPDFAGDGTGYKLGKEGGDHVLTNDLAVRNAGHGVDINANGTGVQVYNTTSYDNGKANWYFDETATQTQNQHILKNNVSYDGTWPDVFYSGVDHSFNSWNGKEVTDDDFVSLERVVDLVDLLKAPRQADGSLPDLGDYLQLAEDSDLVDMGMPISFEFAGVPYSLHYNGLAPDLGAFEIPEPGSVALVGLALLPLMMLRNSRRGL